MLEVTAGAVALAGATVNPEGLGFPMGRPTAHWGGSQGFLDCSASGAGGKNQAGSE